MNRKQASQELEHTVPVTSTPALALPRAHYMAVSKSQLLWASLSGAARWEEMSSQSYGREHMRCVWEGQAHSIF